MVDSYALTEAVYYILLSLVVPQHGYGIMLNTERLSRGRVRLAAGTLYGALNSLSEKGWIAALPCQPCERKKEYQITVAGLNALEAELSRLRLLVKNGEDVLGGSDNV